jgi:hypothetical protein
MVYYINGILYKWYTINWDLSVPSTLYYKPTLRSGLMSV